MVTGRRPFDGDSHLSVAGEDSERGSGAAERGSSRRSPPDVERAILRCLRKDPARRFQTMADLKVALEDLAADSRPPAAGRRRRRRRAVVAVAMAWAASCRRSSGRRVRRLETCAVPGRGEPLRAVPLTALPGVTRYPSFSPDGNQVAFSWTGPDGTIRTSTCSRSAPATTAPDEQSGQRLQPAVVARRPLDRLPAPAGGWTTERVAPRPATRRPGTQAGRHPAARVPARRDAGLVSGLELRRRHRFNRPASLMRCSSCRWSRARSGQLTSPPDALPTPIRRSRQMASGWSSAARSRRSPES